MTYEEFEKHMAEKFPRYFGEGKHYGGFAIGEGWYAIIEALMVQIDHYTKWKRNTRARDLKKVRAKERGLEALVKFHSGDRMPTDWHYDLAEEDMEKELDVTEKVNWVKVEQIKEKFGGLRFYYQGGDSHISGMVTMAESWAYRSCETCGNRGEQRKGGWIRTLCDTHEAEYQAKQKERNNG